MSTLEAGRQVDAQVDRHLESKQMRVLLMRLLLRLAAPTKSNLELHERGGGLSCFWVTFMCFVDLGEWQASGHHQRERADRRHPVPEGPLRVLRAGRAGKVGGPCFTPPFLALV